MNLRSGGGWGFGVDLGAPVDEVLVASLAGSKSISRRRACARSRLGTAPNLLLPRGRERASGSRMQTGTLTPSNVDSRLAGSGATGCREAIAPGGLSPTDLFATRCR